MACASLVNNTHNLKMCGILEEGKEQKDKGVEELFFSLPIRDEIFKIPNSSNLFFYANRIITHAIIVVRS